MTRLIVILLGILFSTLVQAQATRRLSADCTVPSTFVPTETAPFDLDWCSLSEKDDVRLLLLDMANKWPGRVYVRAPSKTIELVTDTINWQSEPTEPVRVFMFMEDGDPANRLVIRHVPSADKYRMWIFENFDTVKIGGPKLSMTIQGTHPGLGTGEPDAPAGLLHFSVNDRRTPELIDLRVNIRDAQQNGFAVYGGPSLGSPTNRVKQLNVSGLMWNAPGGVHSGVQNVWYDRDNLKFSDPYNRTYGWDGKVAMEAHGRQIGCYDTARSQVRSASAGVFMYVDSAVGGLTIEYGFMNWIPRKIGRLGNGAADPFVVKIKDLGASGPSELTGFPSGVAVQKHAEANFFKGDPHEELGRTEPFRFLRLVALKPDYGNGVYSGAILREKCAPDNTGERYGATGNSNLFRWEANRGGQSYQAINALWDVELVGDWDGSFSNKAMRGPLLLTAFSPSNKPGPTSPDRSFGHIFRAGAATTISDSVSVNDTMTITGPGSWTDIVINSITVDDGSETISPKNNRVASTNVLGLVRVEARATGTVVSDVNFVGAPRTIIAVGSNSNVSISNVCAPDGSVIDGEGTIDLDGVRRSLPYVLYNAKNCAISDAGKPAAPENVSVE